MGAGLCTCGDDASTNEQVVVATNPKIAYKNPSLQIDVEASHQEQGDSDTVPKRPRTPTGLFTVELVFMEYFNGVESLVFLIEHNELGFALETKTKLAVSAVDSESAAETAGVRPGMVLTSVAGKDITAMLAPQALDILHTAIRELPPPPSAELKIQRSISSQSSINKPVRKESSEKFMLLTDEVCLTGPWNNWKLGTANAWLNPVITEERKWGWHLYPRDAKPIKIGWISSHVSREGMLKAGVPDNSIVGLGNDKLGHGVNFHVVEKPGTVVTVWVKVPATPSPDGQSLRVRWDTAEGAKIWYTVEDTGLQLEAGDGINLSRYKKYLPDDVNLD